MRFLLIPFLLAAALTASACEDDSLVPLLDTITDTATIYSAARPELTGRPAAYDFVRLLAVPVEQTGTTGEWDVLLTEQNGAFLFAPAGAFPEIGVPAELAVIEGQTFSQVARAPSDAGAFKADAVPVRTGTVYVVRTRPAPCTRYAKFHVLSIDAAAGAVRFEFLQNPNCGEFSLEPDDD